MENQAGNMGPVALKEFGTGCEKLDEVRIRGRFWRGLDNHWRNCVQAGVGVKEICEAFGSAKGMTFLRNKKIN